MTSSRWPSLALFVLLAFTVAAIGGYATAGSVNTWYGTLHKPAWNPPNWIFGPVWTTLYFLMAVAAWRVWHRISGANSRRTFQLYGAQLALNALWSILFFGLHQPGWALLEVVIFWSVLVTLQFRFRAADRVAGWLWAPYVLWVTFATALNAAVWWLNR